MTAIFESGKTYLEKFIQDCKTYARGNPDEENQQIQQQSLILRIAGFALLALSPVVLVQGLIFSSLVAFYVAHEVVVIGNDLCLPDESSLRKAAGGVVKDLVSGDLTKAADSAKRVGHSALGLLSAFAAEAKEIPYWSRNTWTMQMYNWAKNL